MGAGETPLPRVVGRRLGARHALWLLAPILLWLALRSIPLADVASALRRLNGLQLGAIVAVNLAVVGLLNGRWWAILRALGRPLRLLSLLPVRLAAFSLSYFTPGTHMGGEPLQAYLAHRRHSVPASTAAASVLLDRALEMMVNSGFLAVGIFVVSRLGWVSSSASLILTLLAMVLFVAPATYIAAAAAGRSPATWLARALVGRTGSRWAGQVEGLKNAEIQVGRFVRERTPALAQALALSALSWLALAGEYWIMLRFLRIDLGLAETLASLTAARLAILVPVPGALGALEASQILALAQVGRAPAEGAALALLIRARDVAFGLAGLMIGAVLLDRGNGPRAFPSKPEETSS